MSGFFRLEFNHDSAQGSISDIFRSVNNRRIKGHAIWNDINKDFRLPVGPLLESGSVELHHHALAVAVPRAGLARRQVFLKHLDRFASLPDLVIIAHGSGSVDQDEYVSLFLDQLP